MTYTHTSKKIPRTSLEKQQFKEGVKEYALNFGILPYILDSSLISETQNKNYTIKVIEVGEYYQIYYYSSPKIKKDENKEEIKKKIIDNNCLIRKEKYDINFPQEKKIDIKNINRSKFNMQRLIKSNEKIFKTFLTLTFAENITSLSEANKVFHSWTVMIRRVFPDFAYVGVPEFQKRGAVHYHLLTNIEINKDYHYTRRGKLCTTQLIISQMHFTDQALAKMTPSQVKKCFDVKYWQQGFTSVRSTYDLNVVGYLTKYMTKDIDNRLFSHRRYFNSHNLIKPSENYLDLTCDEDFTYLADLLAHSKELYGKEYFDVFGEPIKFIELKKCETAESLPAE